MGNLCTKVKFLLPLGKTDEELFDMPAQYEISQELEEPMISKKIKAFVKDLDSFTDDKHLKLFLWNKVKSKIS